MPGQRQFAEPGSQRVEQFSPGAQVMVGVVAHPVAFDRVGRPGGGIVERLVLDVRIRRRQERHDRRQPARAAPVKTVVGKVDAHDLAVRSQPSRDVRQDGGRLRNVVQGPGDNGCVVAGGGWVPCRDVGAVIGQRAADAANGFPGRRRDADRVGIEVQPGYPVTTAGELQARCSEATPDLDHVGGGARQAACDEVVHLTVGRGDQPRIAPDTVGQRRPGGSAAQVGGEAGWVRGHRCVTPALVRASPTAPRERRTADRPPRCRRAGRHRPARRRS